MIRRNQHYFGVGVGFVNILYRNTHNHLPDSHSTLSFAKGFESFICKSVCRPGASQTLSLEININGRYNYKVGATMFMRRKTKTRIHLDFYFEGKVWAPPPGFSFSSLLGEDRWLVRMAGRTPSKRKMSSAPSVSVSNNNIVECSQEMSGIIKRILVKLCL